MLVVNDTSDSEEEKENEQPAELRPETDVEASKTKSVHDPAEDGTDAINIRMDTRYFFLLMTQD